MTYLVNGQEVTKTIDNFKLTYEVANVNVSIGGVPGLRIVEITPTYPVVGQRLDVAFNSIQYPITGVKSITTNGEVIPTNMYSMQVLGSGRDGHISIPGE
ncbi:MAG: hypothetical protein MJ233_04970 [Mycoplasmoidaceae bacterium]|nr:hypothetical protein [Mycoplasmoidaceae bacterium]